LVLKVKEGGMDDGFQRDEDTLFGGNGFVEGVNSGVVQSSIGTNRLGEVG
jgi:hypothetical protein